MQTYKTSLLGAGAERLCKLFFCYVYMGRLGVKLGFKQN